MPAFRVYFMAGRSIIAADVIEAATHDDAADSAVRAISTYPWAQKLAPDGLEVWQGTTLHQAGRIPRSM